MNVGTLQTKHFTLSRGRGYHIWNLCIRRRTREFYSISSKLKDSELCAWTKRISFMLHSCFLDSSFQFIFTYKFTPKICLKAYVLLNCFFVLQTVKHSFRVLVYFRSERYMDGTSWNHNRRAAALVVHLCRTQFIKQWLKIFIHLKSTTRIIRCFRYICMKEMIICSPGGKEGTECLKTLYPSLSKHAKSVPSLKFVIIPLELVKNRT